MYVKTLMWKYEEAYFKMNTFIYNFTNSDAATTAFRAQNQVKNVCNNNSTTVLCTALLIDINATKLVLLCWSKTPRTSRNRWLVAILIGMRRHLFDVRVTVLFERCSSTVATASTKRHSSATWELVAFVPNLRQVSDNQQSQQACTIKDIWLTLQRVPY